jgi:hypothetical protein
LDIVNIAVRFIVLAFVLVAGFITIAGPQMGIGKNIVPAEQSAVPILREATFRTSAEKSAEANRDTTG